MLGRIKQLWNWIAGFDAVASIFERLTSPWAMLVVSGFVGSLSGLVAALREYDPLIQFLIGLATFALVVVVLTAVKVWMACPPLVLNRVTKAKRDCWRWMRLGEEMLRFFADMRVRMEGRPKRVINPDLMESDRELYTSLWWQHRQQEAIDESVEQNRFISKFGARLDLAYSELAELGVLPKNYTRNYDVNWLTREEAGRNIVFGSLAWARRNGLDGDALLNEVKNHLDGNQ